MTLPNADHAIVEAAKIVDYLLDAAHPDNGGKAQGMATVKEHERVVLTRPVPNEGLEAGDVGTVVHVYRDGLAYELEFTTLDGRTAAVVTVEASDIRPVSRREITHAREFAAR